MVPAETLKSLEFKIRLFGFWKHYLEYVGLHCREVSCQLIVDGVNCYFPLVVVQQDIEEVNWLALKAVRYKFRTMLLLVRDTSAGSIMEQQEANDLFLSIHLSIYLSISF